MRTLLVLLVLVNLGFAAWALLIDRPVYPPAAHDISHLPKLRLASEASSATPVAAGSQPANAALPGHCVTVGPFNDIEASAAAAQLLKSRGFTPVQRDEPGADLTDYWVYLDVATDADANRVLRKLHSGGVADARIMPVTPTSDTRRVSVGLFTERDGADRRSKQVKALGLAPLMSEAHQSQATYWVNIALNAPGQIVSTEGLVPQGTDDGHLEIRDCPVPGSSAPDAASAPAASSAPRHP